MTVMFLQTTVDSIMSRLPLPREDLIVLHNHLLDLVSS